jgi:hypothetical protein
MSGGRVKRGTCRSRGYIGYHTTWDNKRVFLRSKAEFIYARMLDIEKIPYKLECCTYDIRGIRYKPDFFIFDSTYTTITKIVEIKGLDDKATALRYLASYKDFFNSIGIDYEVVWKFQGIVAKYELKKEVEAWVQKSIETYDHISDVSGESNPMYGKKHKASTVELIRQKALLRQTEDYRKHNSERQKEYFKTQDGIERRQRISEQRKAYNRQHNPVVNKNCKECNSDFESKYKSNREFCSSKCLRAWSYKNIPDYGTHKHKHKLK